MNLTTEEITLLLDSSIDAVLWMNQNGHYRYASPAFTKLTGHAPEELLADPGLFERLVHPDDREPFHDHLESLLSPEHARIDLRLITKSGETRWFTHSCKPVFDAATGQLTGRISHNRDITDRKTTELKLHAAMTEARRFNDALDHVGAFVFMRDTKYHFAYANRLTLEFFGTPVHKLIGVADTHFFPPDTIRQLRLLDQRVLAGEDAAGEVTIALGDGSHYTYWVILSPIYTDNHHGTVAGITGIATDITAGKRQEQSLAFLSHRSQILAELAKIAETLDEAAFIQYGIERAEALTGSATAFFRIAPGNGDVAPAGQADGQRQIQVAVTEQGQVVALAGVGNKTADYTERDVETLDLIASEVWRIVQQRRTEQELANNLFYQQELNQKLEETQNQLLQSEKLASIGQLAAGVAHEINNPVGFINSNFGSLEGYLHDLFAITDSYDAALASAAPCPQFEQIQALKREKDYDFLRNDIFQLMQESKDGLDRVARIVRDLKDFSRVGAADWEAADLHAGLDSTLNIVASQIKYKCTVIKDYGQLPPVWCVPSQLNQVFMNLLVNAGHAIPEQGEITLRTGVRDDEVFVAISDTGVGIPPENLKRIFDPFFTTKPVGSGTGLGLSLVYGIVQNHHGRIEVQSEPGQGTTFTVRLPIKAPAAALSPTP